MKRSRSGSSTSDRGGQTKTLTFKQQLQAAMKHDSECSMFNLTIPDESNMTVIQVRMPSATFFEDHQPLFDDLSIMEQRTGRDYIELLMYFPTSYPTAPPFVRVTQPRFAFHTGHVTVGGSICTALLTTSGWIPSLTIESIILFIHRTIIEGQGRVDLHSPLVTVPYSDEEAKQAFHRVANDHGWTV